MKFILALLTGLVFLAAMPAQAAQNLYQRVMQAGSIRCGYIVWPPYFQHDSANGKFSGMNYDYVEAVGRALGLKIDWAMEVTPGSQVEALRSGKIDAICAADGPMVPSTIKYIAYSEPLAFVPFYLYARADDARFAKGAEAVKDPQTRIAVIDGDVSGQISAIHFPKAERYAMPQLAAPGQMMLDVAGGKADIVINDPLSMADYFKSNPGKLRRVPGPSVAVIPNTLSVLRGDDSREFLDLLNQGIDNVRYTGQEKELLNVYEKPGDSFFYSVAAAYK